MKLSIVISILNSHEIVRRQILHFERMGLPDDVELLFMDDGSDPPLRYDGTILKNLRIIPTHNPHLYSRKNGMFADGRVSIARNMGAKMARGEFLLMTDIDYIIHRDSIEAGRTCQYDKKCFRREFGVLMEDGTATQDLTVLRQYGLLEERIQRRNVILTAHPNNFIMRKATFFAIGGYRENIADRAYPSGGDRWFKRDWTQFYAAGKATLAPMDERTSLWMFPNGQWCGDVDYNPFGLFHTLSRKTDRNYWYVKNLPG